MRIAYKLASAVALTASLTLSTDSGAAWAITPAPLLGPAPVFGTGENLNPGDRDNRWKIVAAPFGFVPPESIPHDAYTYISQLLPVTIGGVTYNPISITDNGDTGFADSINRNWILAQTFTVPDAGNYLFDLQASADNGLKLFVNGVIDALTDPDQPTISGGTLIGEAEDFSQFFPISATATLPSGSNTLYAVLNDFGPPTSFIIIPNPNSSAVPAPLPLIGVAAAFGASRRLRNRIRIARPLNSEKAG